MRLSPAYLYAFLFPTVYARHASIHRSSDMPMQLEPPAVDDKTRAEGIVEHLVRVRGESVSPAEQVPTSRVEPSLVANSGASNAEESTSTQTTDVHPSLLAPIISTTDGGQTSTTTTGVVGDPSSFPASGISRSLRASFPATDLSRDSAVTRSAAVIATADFTWDPVVGQSWQYNLNTPVDVDANADIFFIDMDDQQDTIDALHEKDRIVVCYISIGSVEDWRDDADDFPASAIGNDLDNWPGEKWLDINNEAVKEIMIKRVNKAFSMGCDGIEPDNMMVYSEGSDTGVVVSEAEQIQYNTWFAEVVHVFGMRVGLKNTVELADAHLAYFDFALNESCHLWSECESYVDTFIAAGKPVFNVEYMDDDDVCDASIEGMDTIIKNYDLGAPVCSCEDASRDLDCDQVIG